MQFSSVSSIDALPLEDIMQHLLEPGAILRERYEILELVGQGGSEAQMRSRAVDRRGPVHCRRWVGWDGAD